ncbi:MAG: AAA family ATPase [Chloroflexi bacterium]|uniref:Nuclease SbcCD subunit C n=1 Tax=Candidatus Chlorohelix allophototropha TaxID=3003348 RepID=A0A8T7M4D4_9CHLR|nr:AAA family ATPase [Chloroflexota bacterium]WJW70065.1 AAA family ATPase [Chloroflexota bacterium L227-S17]
MKIHHIRLRNYRQYLDAQIKFSTDPDRNLTLIQGFNGAGKSNLLNSITWCLYGEERHLQQDGKKNQLPILNEKVYHSLNPGDLTKVEVELALGDDSQIEYRITRKFTTEISI